MRRLTLMLFVVATTALFGQVPVATGPDPLTVGKSALQRQDWHAAHAFFATYLTANPSDTEAKYYLASSDLELGNFAEAAKECREIIVTSPKEWGAHRGLVFALARLEDWPAFDKERAVLKAARDASTPGLDKENFDRIDQFTMRGEVYEVRYYYKLHGRFNIRYIFLHFAKDGKADHWIELESDDVDQWSYKEKHPKEAAAGDRMYSLDTMAITANGHSQGLMRFYEGEPTYEQVRADVMKRSAPAATSSAPTKPAFAN